MRIATEQVDHPKHYLGEGLEAIDVIEAYNLNFSMGNAVKYILRSGKKEMLQKIYTRQFGT